MMSTASAAIGLSWPAAVSAAICLGLAPALASSALPLFTAPSYDVSLDIAHMAAIDVDGDNRKELVLSGTTYNLHLDKSYGAASTLFQTPDGALAREDLPIPSWQSVTPAIAFGDFNGDGLIDFVAAGNELLAVFLRNPSGPFLFYDPGVRERSLAVGDVNGDGYDDIVFSDLQGSLGVLISHGDGTMGPAITAATLGNLDIMTLADVSGDGRLDLVVSGVVILGDGTGHFGPRLDHNATGPFVLADFNSDGLPDIAVADASEAALFILINTGGGTFRPALRLALDSPPTSIAARQGGPGQGARIGQRWGTDALARQPTQRRKR